VSVIKCQHDSLSLVQAAWEAEGRLADHEIGQHLARQIAERLIHKLFEKRERVLVGGSRVSYHNLPTHIYMKCNLISCHLLCVHAVPHSINLWMFSSTYLLARFGDTLRLPVIYYLCDHCVYIYIYMCVCQSCIWCYPSYSRLVLQIRSEMVSNFEFGSSLLAPL
jgi:hypothetical protein